VRGKKRTLAISRVVLRPAFTVCLFLSQFTSNRDSFFTTNRYMVGGGVAFVAAAIWLWTAASIRLREAQQADEVAMSGPFQAIRHPIYASIYILSIGLGLMFFAWAWFLVLVVFLPLWYWECRIEEEEMEARYGEAYAAYRERTKMFIPGIV